MISSTSKFYMVLCLVLLLISTCESEPKLCGRPSRTYSGPCTDWDCDKECIDSELDAMLGSCEDSYCFCFFSC
ncbi:hypothetical protein P8452_73615 [Trifolium repens]|nr:hypothetical protein P8452_73615 [Trifolium repens]